jgi:hypothetical protein
LYKMEETKVVQRLEMPNENPGSADARVAMILYKAICQERAAWLKELQPKPFIIDKTAG